MKIFVAIVLLVNSLIVLNSFLIDPLLAARHAGELVALNAGAVLLGVIPYLFFRKRYRFSGPMIFGSTFCAVGTFAVFYPESSAASVAGIVLLVIYAAIPVEKWRESKRHVVNEVAQKM